MNKFNTKNNFFISISAYLAVLILCTHFFFIQDFYPTKNNISYPFVKKYNFFL